MPAKGYVLRDFKLYFDGYNLSGWHDRLRFGISVPEVPCPVSGMTAQARLCGFKSAVMEHSGFYEADSVNISLDDILHPAQGAQDKVITVCPVTGAAGEIAYFTRGIALKYQIGGKIGGMFPFSGAAYSQGEPVVRGTVLQNGVVSASGNGTGYQIGAVAAGKFLYAAVHCISTTGSGDRAMTVKVQSDDNSGFTSPTDRITFNDFTTAAGAQWATAVAGPITDTYWRLNFTKAGTTASMNIIGVVGIL
jgi:hypothetical protein